MPVTYSPYESSPLGRALASIPKEINDIEKRYKNADKSSKEDVEFISNVIYVLHEKILPKFSEGKTPELTVETVIKSLATCPLKANSLRKHKARRQSKDKPKEPLFSVKDGFTKEVATLLVNKLGAAGTSLEQTISFLNPDAVNVIAQANSQSKSHSEILKQLKKFNMEARYLEVTEYNKAFQPDSQIQLHVDRLEGFTYKVSCSVVGNEAVKCVLGSRNLADFYPQKVLGFLEAQLADNSGVKEIKKDPVVSKDTVEINLDLSLLDNLEGQEFQDEEDDDKTASPELATAELYGDNDFLDYLLGLMSINADNPQTIEDEVGRVVTPEPEPVHELLPEQENKTDEEPQKIEPAPQPIINPSYQKKLKQIYDQLEELSKVGDDLKKIDATHSRQIHNYKNELEEKLNIFKNSHIAPTKAEVKNFANEFKQDLESSYKKPFIKEHSNRVLPIIANILMLISGIFTIPVLVKAASNYCKYGRVFGFFANDPKHRLEKAECKLELAAESLEPSQPLPIIFATHRAR